MLLRLSSSHHEQISILATIITIALLFGQTQANYATQHQSDIDQTSINFLLPPPPIAPSNASWATESETIELYLDHLAPDLRQLRDFTSTTQSNDATKREEDDRKNVDLSLGAWKLMRNQAQRVVNRKLEVLEPYLIEFLRDAKVSQDCIGASQRTIEAGKRLESWAIQSKYIQV